MKSQVNILLHVTQALHKDVLGAYPTMMVELSRDFERLARLVENRGIGIYTLDLPHLESLLLQGLESGRLVLEGPLSSRVSKRIHVPKLYSGLWLRIFHIDGCLKQDVDVQSLFFLRQLLVLGKKLEMGCSHDRTQAAVEKYHDIEHGLRNPTLKWDCDSLWSDGQSRSDDFSDRDVDTLPLYPSGNDCSFPQDEEGLNHAGQPEASESREDCHKFLGSLTDAVADRCTLPLFQREGRLSTDRTDQRLLDKVQQVADLIVGSFPKIDPVTFSGDRDDNGDRIGFKHGPGAVAERLKNHEKSGFPNWPLKLQGKFPFESCGKTVGDDRVRPPNHEVASRLICVPKTSKTPRLIAAEPTAHQWCQQLVMAYFFNVCENLFEGSFIDFKDQSKSGDLVLAASYNRKLATVDLSDASDRLTCWTVERLFRANSSILDALHAARTRYIRDEISDEVGFLKLRKFASQGTAVTFPVMSLTMLFIALGASIEGKVTWSKIARLRHKVRVFGDDIILPKTGYARLVRVMDCLQLKVNVAKSYVSGDFRESCGVDGFRGACVTPVKPKTLAVDGPAACQAVVDTSNNLFNKGLWYASSACYDLLPARVQRGIRIVGRNATGFAGLTSFSGSDEHHLKKRWNTRLHRTEVRVWTLQVKTRKRDRQGYTALLDFFAQQHNSEHARSVSEYADIRKTRDGFLWEPANSGTHVYNDGEKELQSLLLPERGSGASWFSLPEFPPHGGARV